jgi:membrane-bound ClpP family serine protease
MNLDIKIPIGLLFTILGVLLTIYGLFTLGDTELYTRSLNININLWTGLTMVIIGVFMLSTAKYRKKPTDL